MLAGPVIAQSVSVPVVAQTKLILGEVVIREGSGSETRATEVNQSLFEGDLVVTGADGVVHLAFVDGALLSVRPNSELLIERYRYNPTRPSESEIKLNLLKGVVRSISGEGAHNAKDKFRLNTPVAAIGVRGTDFVVAANGEQTKAIVNSGGIVVAPFSENCSASGVGPCESNFVELFSNEQRAIFVSSQDAVARFIPLSAQILEELSAPDPDSSLQDSPQSERKGDTNSATESSAGSESAESAVSKGAQSQINNSAEVDAEIAVDLPERVFENTVPVELVVQEASPSQDAESEPVLLKGLISDGALEQRAMAWGRYSVTLESSDKITLNYRDARDRRKVLLVDSGYGLYRESSEFEAATLRESISFELAGINAAAIRAGDSQALAATQAELTVNFRDSAFDTRLNLVDEAGRDYRFEAEGLVSKTGVLLNQTEGVTLRGGVDGSGDEAAYLFESSITPDLRIEGRTLWDSRK